MADASSHENQGRALHALLFAQQAHQAGSEVELIFDGGGVEWAKKFPEDDNFKPIHDELIEKGVIKGVCAFCSGAFEVKDELATLNANLMDEHNGHPNIGERIANGWTPVIL